MVRVLLCLILSRHPYGFSCPLQAYPGVYRSYPLIPRSTHQRGRHSPNYGRRPLAVPELPQARSERSRGVISAHPSTLPLSLSGANDAQRQGAGSARSRKIRFCPRQRYRYTGGPRGRGGIGRRMGLKTPGLPRLPGSSPGARTKFLVRSPRHSDVSIEPGSRPHVPLPSNKKPYICQRWLKFSYPGASRTASNSGKVFIRARAQEAKEEEFRVRSVRLARCQTGRRTNAALLRKGRKDGHRAAPARSNHGAIVIALAVKHRLSNGFDEFLNIPLTTVGYAYV